MRIKFQTNVNQLLAIKQISIFKKCDIYLVSITYLDQFFTNSLIKLEIWFILIQYLFKKYYLENIGNILWKRFQNVAFRILVNFLGKKNNYIS